MEEIPDKSALYGIFCETGKTFLPSPENVALPAAKRENEKDPLRKSLFRLL
jgi:hypothetical protein